MTRYISDELRQLVTVRAGGLCEYCLMDIEASFYGGELDHIIAVKHGGPATAENLAHTCQCCNRNKGSDICSINWQTGELVRLFNPRRDHWAEHFVLAGVRIQALTEIGEMTVRILDFNHKERIEERQVWIEEGSYPPVTAQTHLKPQL